MRRIGFIVLLTLACSLLVTAQNANTPPTPQSARAALIEMFTGKSVDAFTKHLPDEARHALLRKGEGPDSSIALRIAGLVQALSSQGAAVETFEAGPNIMVRDTQTPRERLEIAVEHDNLMGEDDEIELSIHSYKDGVPESLPVIPRIIFAMRQVKDIWRLAEITVAAHAPLTDPDYLKVLRKEQDDANQNSAEGRMNMIAQAETGYRGGSGSRLLLLVIRTLQRPVC